MVKKFQQATAESIAYADAHPDEVRQIITTYTKIPPSLLEQVTLPKWPAEANRSVHRGPDEAGPRGRPVQRGAGPRQAAAVKGVNLALGAAGLAAFLALGEAVPGSAAPIQHFPPTSRIADALGDELANRAPSRPHRRHPHRLGPRPGDRGRRGHGWPSGRVRRPPPPRSDGVDDRVPPPDPLGRPHPPRGPAAGRELRSVLLLVVYASFWQILIQVLYGVDVDPCGGDGPLLRPRHLGTDPARPVADRAAVRHDRPPLRGSGWPLIPARSPRTGHRRAGGWAGASRSREGRGRARDVRADRGRGAAGPADQRGRADRGAAGAGLAPVGAQGEVAV
ncbi:hypothetical protein STENM327S_00221 [Streptomyces tendae]